MTARRLLVPTILLLTSALASAQTVVRGPYLQLGTPTGIVIRWRTDLPTDSVVRYGTQQGVLNATVTVAGGQTEHEVSLSGLTPETNYWYAVGTTSGNLSALPDQTFKTAPTVGARRRTRIWVLGDSGTANGDARSVRDAYQNYVQDRPTDLWMMLGDNAYLLGTDAEYQTAVFDTYSEMLRRSVLWPTLGNHDAFSTTTPQGQGPYYDIFTLPTAGEAGGQPSGTEGYYSFDHANVHFVCLNSAQGDATYVTTMRSWLQTDLASTAQEWIIAFWHHPPYSKGSHDSDAELRLQVMRQFLVPVLEAGGVDLVLCGHSHSYERSMLIDGHYGDSATFDVATMGVDPGDGRFDGTGAYQKPSHGPGANEGAVYVVAGSSGLIQPGPLDHPVMIRNLKELGSCVLELWGSQLDVVFLDDLGATCDRFTLTKGGVTPVIQDSRRTVGRTCAPMPLDLGDPWRFNDLGLDLGTAWRDPGYDDAAWAFGFGPLGFGEVGLSTTVSFGNDPANVHPTTYFRHEFTLGPDPSDVAGMRLLIDYDDGFSAWLNGVEVARSASMPASPIPLTYGTYAIAPREGGVLESFDLAAHTGLLVPGRNVLAIEVHQVVPFSSDLYLDARLWTYTAEQIWRYEDSGTDLGTTWRDPGFDASNWTTGAAPLGYGEPGLNTTIASGPVGASHPAAYFRRAFDLQVEPIAVEGLRLHTDADDGLVAYLNGVEVARWNMPAGPIFFGTPSTTFVEPGTVQVFDISQHIGLLTATGNVLAIEVHQWGAASSDLFLEASLEYDTRPIPLLPDCAKGAVNGAQGELESVLTVNGSDGGLGRSVDVAALTPIELRLDLPSVGTGGSPYLIALYSGTPGQGAAFPLSPTVGTLCFSPLAPFGSILSSNIPGFLGPIPATPLPFVLSLPAGLTGPLEFTAQGVISVAPGMFRATNAVRLRIAP